MPPSKKQVREALIRRNQRFIASFLLAQGFMASDDLTRALGELPEGIDPRSVTGAAFRQLRRLGLIRKAALADSPRRGGYQALWAAADREGLAAWLQTNPPLPAAPPIIRQMAFSFVC